MPQATLALTQALLEPPGNLPDGHLALIDALQSKVGKAALGEADIIVRPVRLTGDQLSCLFTRFPREELESLAAQINEAGGPLMSAHLTDDTPIGRFYAASVTEEDGALWLDCWAYWLADEQGYKLARDIDAGIIAEASIGWSWETAQCSVCGEDFSGWDCPHWPGETYQVAISEDSQETEERLCFLWMIGCEFDEGSLVYKGGHPNTQVGGTLANVFTPVFSGNPPAPGQLAPHLTSFQLQATRDMATLYQKTKPKKLGKPTQGDGLRPDPPTQANVPEGEQVKYRLKKQNGKVIEVETEEQMQDLLEEGYTLGKQGGAQEHLELAASALGLEPKDLTPERMGQLKAQAADGAAYRKNLEGRLAAAAVTVEGQGGKAERIAKLGAKADTEDLEGLVDDWEAKALVLVPNGRLSETVPEEGPKKKEALPVDDV